MPLKKYISNREHLHTDDGVKGLGDAVELTDAHADPLLALGAIKPAEVDASDVDSGADAVAKAAAKAAADETAAKAAAEKAAAKAAAKKSGK